ncbi:MAG: Ig-like domain-containing protein [Kofleriaceae bacterium]
MHFLLGLVVGVAFDTSTAADGTEFVRQAVPPTATSVHAKSRVIYLNRWGGTLKPGVNDSRKNTSSIVPAQVQLDGWDVTDAMWNETVACMRAMWGRFDVDITDLDPGDSVQHIEAMFGDSPTKVGLGANVGGVAPMAVDCSTVENSIVFTFTKNLPKKAQIVCEVMSQEIGHSYGLDHELEASDPMTYLSYTHARTFQDREVACGESVARPCGVASHSCRAKQNTVDVLYERLGPAGADHDAPAVNISDPVDGATVAPGFVVVADASDNIGVVSVELYVDGKLAGTRYAAPFEFTMTEIAAGHHVLRVEASDALDNTTSSQLDVYVEQASPGIDEMVGCSAGGAPGIGLAVALLALRRRRRT